MGCFALYIYRCIKIHFDVFLRITEAEYRYTVVLRRLAARLVRDALLNMSFIC